MSNKASGLAAEQLAAEFLVKLGYTILVRNYKASYKELDIIAQIGDEIVFVEVKSLKNTFFGEPFEMLSQKQQENLFFAAEHYLETIDHDGDSRFDLISIVTAKSPPSIEHFVDCFGPSF